MSSLDFHERQRREDPQMENCKNCFVVVGEINFANFGLRFWGWRTSQSRMINPFLMLIDDRSEPGRGPEILSSNSSHTQTLCIKLMWNFFPIIFSTFQQQTHSSSVVRGVEIYSQNNSERNMMIKINYSISTQASKIMKNPATKVSSRSLQFADSYISTPSTHRASPLLCCVEREWEYNGMKRGKKWLSALGKMLFLW